MCDACSIKGHHAYSQSCREHKNKGTEGWNSTVRRNKELRLAARRSADKWTDRRVRFEEGNESAVDLPPKPPYALEEAGGKDADKIKSLLIDQAEDAEKFVHVSEKYGSSSDGKIIKQMVQQAKRNRVRNLRVSKKLFDGDDEKQLQCNLVHVGTAPTSVDVEPILNIDIDLDTDPIVIIATLIPNKSN